MCAAQVKIEGVVNHLAAKAMTRLDGALREAFLASMEMSLLGRGSWMDSCGLQGRLAGVSLIKTCLPAWSVSLPFAPSCPGV